MGILNPLAVELVVALLVVAQVRLERLGPACGVGHTTVHAEVTAKASRFTLLLQERVECESEFCLESDSF